MNFKNDIDKVRERLYAFWQHEMIDRACITVIAPNKKGEHVSMFHNPENMADRPEDIKKYWQDPETIYKNNIKRLSSTFMGGDILPIVFQNYGTSGHCNYFGAKPTLGNDTIWFNPVWDSLEDARTAYTEELLNRHLAIAKYLTDNSNGDYFVGMPDSTGTIDALGHLYGTENVMMDMLAEPETVKEAIKIVNDGWKKTNEQFYQISKELNQGGAHAWMHLLAPGRLQHMQCDMSVMFSSDMYNEFAVDELKGQLDWLEYGVYHFDGVEQEKHLDYILPIDGIKAIQWTAVAGQPSAANYLPILQRMQRAGKSLVIMAPATDVPKLLDGLSSKGLYIHTEADCKETAEDIVKYVEKNSKAD